MTRLLERPKAALTARRRNHKLPAVDAVKPIDLDAVLAGEPVGNWVVLDPGMTKILGSAASPAKALVNARERAAASSNGSAVAQPVLIQVPDPKLRHYYL
jgi:hypothetical protein